MTYDAFRNMFQMYKNTKYMNKAYNTQHLMNSIMLQLSSGQPTTRQHESQYWNQCDVNTLNVFTHLKMKHVSICVISHTNNEVKQQIKVNIYSYTYLWLGTITMSYIGSFWCFLIITFKIRIFGRIESNLFC